MTKEHVPNAARTITRRGVVTGASALALASQLRPIAAQTPVSPNASSLADRLLSLLALAPPIMVPSGSPAPPFYYADLETQFASVDIEQPDSSTRQAEVPKGFVEAILALPLAANAYQRGFVDGWLPTFGFVPFAVHRTLTLNVAPQIITMFSGGLDPDAVAEALAGSGFEQTDGPGGAALWSYPDEMDTDSPVFQLGVGTMNHATIVDDTVIFSQQRADIERVAQVVAGQEPSMVEESPWPDLIPTFSGDVVGLIPLFPAAMVAPVPQASATPAGEPSFGGLQHLAFGVRSGSVSAPLSLGGEGTPEATPIGGVESVPAQVEARLRYETPDQAAEQADAIPQRWEEGESVLTAEPFSDVMTVESSSVSATDSNVVAIDFATVGGTNSWIQLIQVRDLSPFLPVEG